MVVYADTSFLFSLYAQDVNTARAAKLSERKGLVFLLTPFQRLEFYNAIRLAAFRRHMSQAEAERLTRQFAEDLEQGAFLEVPLVWTEVFAEAEALSGRHTTGLGTRSLDILHVASAVVLDAAFFFTFDKRQAALTREAGLRVKTV
jgi:predicted nucleic acid-binding protein